MIENFPSIYPLVSELPFQKNNYEFLSVIGVGGSSVVFKVKSSIYQTTFFAAKTTPKVKNINLLEIEILKSLVHPNIIPLYDYFEDELNIYLILEFCENGSLSSLIRSGGLTSSEEIIFCMKRLSEALFYCHTKGIVHRDVKPSNILLDSHGNLKLIDFGICEFLYSDKNIDENFIDYYTARKKGEIKFISKFYGSDPYLSPEIILKEPYDPFASDVWALGVTMFEIATGTLPWNNFSGKMRENAICQSIINFPKTTPKSIQNLITAILQVDPKRRPTMKSIVHCSLFKANIYPSLQFFNSSNININHKPKIPRLESSRRRVLNPSQCLAFAHDSINTNHKELPQFLTTKVMRRSSNPSLKKVIYPKSRVTKYILAKKH